MHCEYFCALQQPYYFYLPLLNLNSPIILIALPGLEPCVLLNRRLGPCGIQCNLKKKSKLIML